MNNFLPLEWVHSLLSRESEKVGGWKEGLVIYFRARRKEVIYLYSLTNQHRFQHLAQRPCHPSSIPHFSKADSHSLLICAKKRQSEARIRDSFLTQPWR